MILIPLPESIKWKLDCAAISGAFSLPFFTAIPWVDIAGFVTALYGILRLLEWAASRMVLLIKWLRTRKRADK